MNWDAVAAIAELIASAGVIVSLVYLATQIRRQTSENLLSASHQLASQLDHIWSGVSDNAEFAELYYRGIKDFDSLDRVEKVRIAAFFARMMRILESMYSRHLLKQIDPAIWPGIEVTCRELSCYAGFQVWWANTSHWFTEEFRAWVLDCMAEKSHSGLNN